MGMQCVCNAHAVRVQTVHMQAAYLPMQMPAALGERIVRLRSRTFRVGRATSSPKQSHPDLMATPSC